MNYIQELRDEAKKLIHSKSGNEMLSILNDYPMGYLIIEKWEEESPVKDYSILKTILFRHLNGTIGNSITDLNDLLYYLNR